MKIPLTKGYDVEVDTADYHWLSQWKWYAQVVKKPGGDRIYAVRTQHLGKGEDGRYKSAKVYMHREIVAASGMEFGDHISGNTLDNRRKNLRACHPLQSAQNVRRVRSKSGYVGVAYLPPEKYPQYTGTPYKAHISVNMKSKHLGYFKTAIEAALARDAYAREHHGAFAVLNFPEGLPGEPKKLTVAAPSVWDEPPRLSR